LGRAVQGCAQIRGGNLARTVKEWGFPIAGADVTKALNARFSPEDIWELSFFDVPSGTQPSTLLHAIGDAVYGGPCQISTSDLCAALDGAPQVWILDIRLLSNRSINMHIEDGVLFELNVDDS
ncbi:hypothetical protein KQ945_18530, partial [Bacillus subtilis subsp. subtilis]|nr:hypothetical protein [Bacillus subtilis subsp. subtilis]